ncbi:MAG: GNAT family N-acetyltransferase [Pseudorhodoferax sp.]
MVGAEVAAKGQLVHLAGSVAYISDIFTAPAHRRQGLCHRIVLALERKARALGATHACRAPGQEAASFGLYGKPDYAPVAERALLIRREPPA